MKKLAHTLVRMSLVATAGLCVAGVQSARAQSAPPKSSRDTVSRDSVATLGGMTITAERDTRPTLSKLTMPVSASITAKRVQETVNLMDTEDAVKYLPSVFLRKRNNGDTQAVMATRVWGVSSSARSLIFADGVPLTALIANNNNIGGPRWGLVSPEEIDRIDMMYGPFSAAYAGNSMGAVMEIATHMPQKLEASVTQAQTMMPFDLYATKQTFSTAQTSARVGDRFGKFSFTLAGNYQNSFSQPLSYVTATSFPTGTSGGFPATNKLGVTANVLGASGLLHTKMANAKAKVAYDVLPGVQLAYTYAYWQNDANVGVSPYITKGDDPTFAAQSGFASGNYGLLQAHVAQSISLRTDRHKSWDFELIGSNYDMAVDRQRLSTTAAATGLTFGSVGRVAELSGTGWRSADAKGAWHAGGVNAKHIVTFGAHYDQYTLLNPTFNTNDWTVEKPVYTTVSTEGDGKTRTAALWAQDSWTVAPTVNVVLGARYEDWKAYDGYNVNGTTKVTQATLQHSNVSPKATVAWTPNLDWNLKASVGKAYRYATAGELFQLVTTGTTFTAPDPTLKPDNVLSTELRATRQFSQGSVQLSLFNDDVHDAIISQFKPLLAGSTTLYSFVSNVDHVRARGAELVVSENGVLISGLELSGSATYLDAKTLALSGRASATATADAAVGKQLPNIPDWRATFLATYRPTARLSLSVGGRYSGALWTTLDNTDINPNTYQGFSAWFSTDAHVNYRLGQHLSASVGADNLLNRKYFLFHPFPQRTFSSSLKVTY